VSSSTYHLNRIIATGKGCSGITAFKTEREGYSEEVYLDRGLSPLFDEDRNVLGIIVVAKEVTQQVLIERRLKTLGELARRTSGSHNCVISIFILYIHY